MVGFQFCELSFNCVSRFTFQCHKAAINQALLETVLGWLLPGSWIWNELQYEQARVG